MILINVVSRRVKQLRRGNRPLIVSLEKLSLEDTALREIAERKITYELATPAELARAVGGSALRPVHNAVFGPSWASIVERNSTSHEKKAPNSRTGGRKFDATKRPLDVTPPNAGKEAPQETKVAIPVPTSGGKTKDDTATLV